MGNSHASRVTSQPGGNSLRGKMVFLIGDRRYSQYYAEYMREAGAHVVYSESIKGDELTNPEEVPVVAREILEYKPRPDAVVIFHPKMSLFPQTKPEFFFKKPKFQDNPAMQLAKAMQDNGIPVLIADFYKEHITPPQAEDIRKVGAVYRDLHDIGYDQMVTLVAQMIGTRGRPQSGGRGGAA